MFRSICALILCFACSACTHLSSVSTTSIPAQKGKKVSSEAYRFIFLGFNFNNDYVNEMADSLARTCPGGRVEGLLTKHESIIYFPLFAHAVRVTGEGYCNGATRAAASTEGDPS